jgi:hypothetical protein
MISAKEIYAKEITVKAINDCYYGIVYDVIFNGYGWNDIVDAKCRIASKYFAAKLAVEIAAKRAAEPEFANDLF